MDYQPVPLDLVASLPDLPFPVYLQRDGHMVLYAMPGADLTGVASRTKVGLQVHVPAGDASAMRRLLLVLLARALGARTVPVTDRGRQAVDVAVALLRPLFARERSIDPDGFAAAQAAVDLLASALVLDPLLGRAVIGGGAATLANPEPRRRDADPDAQAEARRCAIRALDGLACAMALATALEPDQAPPGQLSRLELGRGVAFRDVGLPRARAIRGLAPARSRRIASAVDRDHPGLGARLITNVIGRPPVWATVVADHHERLDGSGFPAGRRGRDLSQAVRIAGLADTFASLVTPAPWGYLRSADEAIGVLRLGGRDRFGEDVVWAMVGVLESGRLLPMHRGGSAAPTH